MKRVIWAVTLVTIFAGQRSEAASQDGQCLAARLKAAGNYARCQARVMARQFTSDADGRYLMADCSRTYRDTWYKLQARLPESSCSAARWVDNGDGSATDNLTGLVWEKKTQDTSVHRVDAGFAWSASGGAADGEAFTTFLATLNTSPCFAGHCDWRLPTPAELQTILAEPFPCAGCVDGILGPMFPGTVYWSSTTRILDSSYAYGLSMTDGSIVTTLKSNGMAVRAVRGSLF